MKITARRLEIVQCRCEDGLSIRETAAKLGVTVPSIKNMATRLLADNKLRGESGWLAFCFRWGMYRHWTESQPLETFEMVNPGQRSKRVPIRHELPTITVLSAYQAGRIQRQAERRTEG